MIYNMNLPSDFIEWTNMGIPTEYTMPENYKTSFDDSNYTGYTTHKGFYIDNKGKLIEVEIHIPKTDIK